MTKKDYELIASKIKQQVSLRCTVAYPKSNEGEPIFNDEWTALNALAYQLAEVLMNDNSKFDKERFLKACGF